MNSTISHNEAAAATKRILGFYPEIPASDPKSFAAGLAALLSTYPQAVIARAIDPRGGIPAQVEFLNLAKIKKLLDGWYDEHFQDQRRNEIHNRPRLPEPERDPDADRRISDGFHQLSERLKSGFAP